MLKEPRFKEITREDIFIEYYSRLQKDGFDGEILPDNQLKQQVAEANKYFAEKTQMEIMIKGTIQFDKDFKKLFTFLNRTYDIKGQSKEGLEDALRDLDNFKAFMEGIKTHYFSTIENEYVHNERVLNAHIFIELT